MNVATYWEYICYDNIKFSIANIFRDKSYATPLTHVNLKILIVISQESLWLRI